MTGDEFDDSEDDDGQEYDEEELEEIELDPEDEASLSMFMPKSTSKRQTIAELILEKIRENQAQQQQQQQPTSLLIISSASN